MSRAFRLAATGAGTVTLVVLGMSRAQPRKVYKGRAALVGFARDLLAAGFEDCTLWKRQPNWLGRLWS